MSKQSSQPPVDALVIGAGHNGLVCACYLARAGYRVQMLERRGIVGGAAVTEEFHPGFRNSVASYTVSLLNPKVIADLRLYQHGLRVLERPVNNFMPLPGNDYLQLGPTLAASQREVARHSATDAARLADYGAMLDAIVAVLRDLVLQTPPNAGGGLAELPKMLRLSRTWLKLPIERQRDLHELMTRSAGDVLDGWFETEALKAMHGFDAVVGNFASPYSPGTGYVLLHHAFGEVNGKAGVWGHAVGGMGAITQAMAREAAGLGVDIRLEAPVARVVGSSGRATGVELADGTFAPARIVIANVNPKLLFLSLIDPSLLEPAFLARMRRWKCASATFRMNVALSELPRFECLPTREAGDHHRAGIIMSPSLAHMDRAFHDASLRGWSSDPIIEMLIPSTMDDSLAPPGAHVASLFCQHFSPQLPAGRSWDAARDEAADLIIDTVTRYAPNFRSSVLARTALSPLDLERKFGLVGGDIFHGALTLDQIFSARPMLGFADYRTPVRGLYLCGAGAHPGGGVTGLPGHNAAREILRDLRRSRV